MEPITLKSIRAALYPVVRNRNVRIGVLVEMNQPPQLLISVTAGWPWFSCDLRGKEIDERLSKELAAAFDPPAEKEAGDDTP